MNYDVPVFAFLRQLAQERRSRRPFFSRLPRPRQHPHDLLEAGHHLPAADPNPAAVLFIPLPPQKCSPPPPPPTLF